MVRSLWIAAALVTASGCTTAQPPRTAAPAPTVSPADLAGIDAAIDGVYAVISGPPGQKRDFDRMRSLFAPGATLKVVTDKGVRGGTLEDYIKANATVLEKEGFTERELARRVHAYGNLANVWSSYDGATATGSFHERGINNFQLVKVAGRWLVASILWQEETAAFPLPADMER